MPNTLSHSFLYVRDQDEALAFYTGPVGLEVRTDATMDFMRWLSVGASHQNKRQTSAKVTKNRTTYECSPVGSAAPLHGKRQRPKPPTVPAASRGKSDGRRLGR